MPMSEDEKDRMRKAQEMEQALAGFIDTLPGLWRRLYDNCIREGFTSNQALEIVKAAVFGIFGGKLG